MEFCQWALVGCGTAIVAMASYIVYLSKKISSLYDAQIARLESMLQTANGGKEEA